jgi:adenylate cyclase
MRKNLFLILALMIFGTVQLQAQKTGQELVDSLLPLMPGLKDDTLKVNVLNEIAYGYYQVDSSYRAIENARQALELAQKLKWKKGIAAAFNLMGANYLDLHQYELSESYFLKSLALYAELGIKKRLAVINGNMGNLYYAMGNEPRAMEAYLKGSKYAEEIHDTDILLWCYNTLGSFNLEFKDYATCIKYFKLSYALTEYSDNKDGFARIMMNMAVCYQRKNELDTALKYNSRSLEIFQSLGDKSAIANLNGNAALIYAKLKNFPLALKYGFESLKISEDIARGNLLIAWAKYEIGNALLFLSKEDIKLKPQEDSLMAALKLPAGKIPHLKLSLRYLKEAASLGQKIPDRSLLRFVYQDLVMVNRQLNNPEAALIAADSLRIIEDSVFSMEKTRQMNSIEFQSLMEKNRLSDSLIAQEVRNKAELQMQKQRNYTLTGVFIALVFIIFSIYAFRNNRIISKEKKKSDQLLLNILPSDIATELKENGVATARQYEHVTVLFTDFVNFTGVSEKLSPTELVASIHKNFTAFDAIIEKHGLEKIKTIGDAYLAVCGMPHETADHALKVANAAIDIRDSMIQNGNGFEIRLGIHSGPVVAGIVGVKKFAFDIWGDTVNTASRMESHSEPGKINISATTYELIKDQYDCTYRGNFAVKGKGEASMYYVNAKLMDEQTSLSSIVT